MWTTESRALVDDFGAGQALSDEQYALLAPLIPPAKPGGRPRTTDVRRLLDGLFYLVRTGRQWRHLPPPPAFPPWRTIYGYMRAFADAGVWETIRHHLVVMLRERDGREPSPSAAIIDTQSVKATEKGGPAATTRPRSQGQEAARRGRHRRPAARGHRPRRRRPGRGRRRRPAAAAEAAPPLARGRVRRQRLRPARGPAGLLPARADPGHRAPARGPPRLRPPPPALGGGEDARLARQVAPPRQGVRGAARGLRDHGQAGRDPPHAAPPRPPEPQAATRSLTSQTASHRAAGEVVEKALAAGAFREGTKYESAQQSLGRAVRKFLKVRSLDNPKKPLDYPTNPSARADE